ncbi:MAG: glutamyl-tRNA reductase [Armatimonadota bacterium]
MHLVVVGLNHKTAPLWVRERLSIPEAQLSEVLHVLKANPRIAECLVLSTCNRTEVYSYTISRADDDYVITEIGRVCGVSPETYAQHIYSHAGHKAAEHLFRVAAGIDSMILGEAQILGQIKEAYAAACKIGATGPVLNALFQQAITVGKRVRAETEIGRGAFSVGSVAVQLATAIFESLDDRQVLVIGAGKMANLILTHLASSNAKNVLVTNRNYEKALSLASKVGGQALPFDDLGRSLETADIVIASTGSSQAIITKELVSTAMHVRRGRPVFFIDIAVPRDVEQSVEELDNVFVYNIDDLQQVVESDAASRRTEVAKVEAIVAEEVRAFNEWFRTLDAIPVVSALREKFEAIRSGEMNKLRKRLKGLSEEHLEAIEAATRSIVNKISHDPILRVKSYCAEDGTDEKLRMVRELFGISLDENKAEADDLPPANGRNHDGV